jgi:TetR/AcrR family fatty acid metabolism transcriptional regulator
VKSTTRTSRSATTGTDANTRLNLLSDRSTNSEDKRRVILDAAVRVFARKGYHASRVGDIAEEAGVAHGLLYHYFRSKEELVETIFRETWRDILAAVRSVEETDETARERLAGITKILLRSWRRDPDLVRVLVHEVARTSHLQRRIGEIDAAFAGLERIIVRGQEAGEFRSDVDPRMVSHVFYGAVEEILTGWVLGQLEDGDDAIIRAEQTVVEVVCGGLTADREAARL